MAGVEKIIENILSDSEKAAEQLIAAAEENARRIQAKAAEKAKKTAEGIIARGQAEAEELSLRAESAASLEARKRLLAAKREVMDEVFDRLELHFMQQTGEEYVDFLVSLGAGEKGGELIFSERDFKYAPEVAQRLGEGFTLCRQPDKSAESGYIIRNGAVQTHCTVQAVVSEKRRELEPGVAKILFED